MNKKWKQRFVLLTLSGCILWTGKVNVKAVDNKEEITIDEDTYFKPEERLKNEGEVLDFFNGLKTSIKELVKKDDKESEKLADEKMKTYMYFLFKDERIGGYYFDDLTKDAQTKLELDFIYLKEYIEENKPDWLERLKDTSSEVKDYLVDSYNTLKDTFKTWKEEGTLKENIDEQLNKIWENDKENLGNVVEQGKQLFKKYFN